MKQQSNLRENLRKIIKMRGRYISLFALLCLAFSNSIWSAEVDTVWTSDYGNTIQFQHPVTKDLIFVELSFDIGKLITMDSKNGKIIKEVPFKNDWDNKSYISPDGTFLLHTDINNTYIYEYPNLNLIMKLDSCIYSRIINNDEVIGRNYFNSKLVKYNIKTKEKQVFLPEGSVQNIATSPDGRFIAYSISSVGNQQNWSKLVLMDAKTMKDINVIYEVNYNEHYFGNFNFSKDGKYITFNGKVIDGKGQLIIYNIETSKIIKTIKPDDFSFSSGDIIFLKNNLYALSLYDSNVGTSLTQITDINMDKSIFSTDKINTDIVFNNELNHLYFRDKSDKKIKCLNLTNLLTGVTLSQPTTIVKYQNKQLTITKENVRKVEISDISGRVLINKIIENPFSNNIVLPINLMNGQYLINITTDKENFTHKLMVME